jgi:hypothetical protein
MRPAQLANQDRQSGRKPMTKSTTIATAKTKAIRMPGKERPPAASRLGIQGASHTGEPHPRNTGRNTPPPSGSQPHRAQPQRVSITDSSGATPPRVIGHGSLRKARPRLSEHNTNTHPVLMNHKHKLTGSNHTLQTHPATRQNNHVSSPSKVAGFKVTTSGRF